MKSNIMDYETVPSVDILKCITFLFGTALWQNPTIQALANGCPCRILQCQKEMVLKRWSKAVIKSYYSII